MARSSVNDAVYPYGSFSLGGSLMQNDSLSVLGALQFNGSFLICGPLNETDSLGASGVLAYCGSLVLVGALSLDGSLNLYGALPLDGFVPMSVVLSRSLTRYNNMGVYCDLASSGTVVRWDYLARFCWMVRLEGIDSLYQPGLLRLTGSFLPSGALTDDDSFRHYGSLSAHDSFGLTGSLKGYDSLPNRGALDPDGSLSVNETDSCGWLVHTSWSNSTVRDSLPRVGPLRNNGWLGPVVLADGIIARSEIHRQRAQI